MDKIGNKATGPMEEKGSLTLAIRERFHCRSLYPAVFPACSGNAEGNCGKMDGHEREWAQWAVVHRWKRKRFERRTKGRQTWVKAKKK